MSRKDDLIEVLRAAKSCKGRRFDHLERAAKGLDDVLTKHGYIRNMAGVGIRTELNSGLPVPEDILGLGGEALVCRAYFSIGKGKIPWTDMKQQILEHRMAAGLPLDIKSNVEYASSRAKNAEVKNFVCRHLAQKFPYDPERKSFEGVVRIGLENILDPNKKSKEPRRELRQKLLLLNMHENLLTIARFAAAKYRTVYFMQYVPIVPWERLVVKQRIAACLGAIKGVGELHRHKLVHRDIKPDNILVEKGGKAYLADFGLLKSKEVGKIVTSMTEEGMLLGTPIYMAPEQVEEATASYQTDIFSLGAVLYYGLTLEPALQMNEQASVLTVIDKVKRSYENTPPDPLTAIKFRRRDKKLVRRIRDIAGVCMQHEPGDRYDTVALLEEDVEMALKGKEPKHWHKMGGYSPGKFYSGVKQSRTWGRIAAVAGAAVILGGAGYAIHQDVLGINNKIPGLRYIEKVLRNVF